MGGPPVVKGGCRLAKDQGILDNYHKGGTAMKVSSRNVIEGTVKRVLHGVVNTEVILEIPGGQELVSVITKSSADRLELAEGKKVYAMIKASNVILAVD
jgi:molybdopterin-binding protein